MVVFLKTIFSATTSVKSEGSSSSTDELKSNSGETNNPEIENIELEFDAEKVVNNQKHSPSCSNSGAGFSLKNPVSSFRSWVSNKKSSKDDSATNDSSNISNDSNKRNRTNSASQSTTASMSNSSNDLSSVNIQSTRAKKKAPFSLLKRTSESNQSSNETDGSNPETTTTPGALGYLKNLVRGEKP